MEIQQSPLYTQYVRALGWSTLVIDGTTVFYRRLPFIGTMAKLQRPEQLPYLPKLITELKRIHTKTIAIEPKSSEDQQIFSRYASSLSKFFIVNRSPFLPTKTIVVDVTPDTKTIFSNLSQAKRRAVRRAEKYGVDIVSSKNIKDLIAIKNKSAGMFGEMTTYGIDKLAVLFSKKKLLHILIAKTKNGETIGGVLLLIYDDTCYYWIAGATKKGKHMFAPTLLVWEALKFAHDQKCTAFDFVGVWDERMPKQNTSWKGFTKFKEGFGGTERYYPISMLHKSF